MNNFFKGLVPAVALSLPLLAGAESSVEAGRTKPSTQPPPFQSAFADYKPWQDIKPGNWRQLNDALWPATGGASEHAGHVGAPPSQSAPPMAPKSSVPATTPGDPERHTHGGKQ